MEFHDDYPQYEVMANHSDAEGKPIRKKLWRVFWIMLGVTILELIVGSYASNLGGLDHERRSKLWLKVFFVVFTVVKAGYIVMIFMHLGHEVKFMKYTIIAPYVVFICYLVFIILVEGTYVGYPQNKIQNHPAYKDSRHAIVEQLNSGHGHEEGGGHEGTETEKKAE
ncbi:MAG: cytochrome C oxidase subunit IV family protein [Bacteroidia bacterium]|nr:cytochrome C oxidase subunit IV family protein [Bacteroidia bacterium]